MKLKTAAVTFVPQIGQTEENLQLAATLIRQAADGGAQLVLLPELWNTGYDLPRVSLLAEGSSGPSVSLLRESAIAHGVWIAGGSILERRHDKYHNTMFVVAPDGRITAKYRKAHLFPRELQEQQYLSAGDEAVRFLLETGAGAVCTGLAICYDLRFPELFRNLALRGAKLLLVPAYWPKARRAEFELFCRSRAAENRCFLLAANDAPGAPSLAVLPDGEVLAFSSEQADVLFATFDFDLLTDEKYFDSLANRQPFIDEIDNNLL